MIERREMLGGSPFIRGGLAYLHQPQLPGAAEIIRIEPALLPYNSFDQCRLQLVASRRRSDHRIEPMFAPIDAAAVNAKRQSDQEKRATTMHRILF